MEKNEIDASRRSVTPEKDGLPATPTIGTENGHEWVDLGLPSGTKWATCNVGADVPGSYGDYFAWGEVVPNGDYTNEIYMHYKVRHVFDEKHKRVCWTRESITKYNIDSCEGTIDNLTTLEAEDDAASVNWGGAWRMPTDAEWKELVDNCDWRWTADYNGTGVAGRVVTSKANGNSIFLSAAGFRSGGGLLCVGDHGYHWSNSLDTGDPARAWYVVFQSGYVGSGCDLRYFGLSVRPVLGSADCCGERQSHAESQPTARRIKVQFSSRL